MTGVAQTFRFAIVIALLAIVPPSAVTAATPCDGVDRGLTNEQKNRWAPVFKQQLNNGLLKGLSAEVNKDDVLQSFGVGGWRIVYVKTHVSDEVFLFYAGDPEKSRYVSEFSGAAAISEEKEILRGVVKDAPGIPPRLAKCFAWHVTNDRDQ